MSTHATIGINRSTIEYIINSVYIFVQTYFGMEVAFVQTCFGMEVAFVQTYFGMEVAKSSRILYSTRQVFHV
jgi:hypothetical protein